MTESRTLDGSTEAREHATHLALQMMASFQSKDESGGAIVVDTYTAEEGIVITVRLILSIEEKSSRF